MDDYTGRQLGNWTLESLLGTGAFGAVYLAKNPVIGQEAAVKVLHARMATRDIRRRFFAEARAASQARLADDDPRPHPGVVQIFDGDDGSRSGEGLCYIVMERLSGMTLHQALRQGPLSPLLTAQLGAALADTLLAVHRRKVVHRDLKPENIFLQQGDPRRPKILDFGIAKLREGGLGTQGTVPGTVLGTPQYMSPEQGQGLDEVDERSDMYSLGIILFECRTGRVPFDGPNYRNILFQHLTQPAPPLPGDTTHALSRLIHDMLEKEPAARPGAEQVRDLLRRIAAAEAGRPSGPLRPAGPSDRVSGTDGDWVPVETQVNGVQGDIDGEGRGAVPATIRVTPVWTGASAEGAGGSAGAIPGVPLGSPRPAVSPPAAVQSRSASTQTASQATGPTGSQPTGPQPTGPTLPADSMVSFPVEQTTTRSPWRRVAPVLAVAAGLAVVGALAWPRATSKAPEVGAAATPAATPAMTASAGKTPAAPALPGASGPPPPATGPRLSPAVRPTAPHGYLSLGASAVSGQQVTIGDFHRFVDAEQVGREGPGKWPWALSVPLPEQLPINHISPELAGRYCRWRLPGGRLPTRAELQKAGPRLSRGKLPDLVAGEPVRGLLSFRCAVDLGKDPP